MEKVLLWIIRACTGVILLLPLVVTNTQAAYLFFDRMIFFQILVEIAAAAWCVLAIHKKEYRPSFRHPLILTLTVFIGALLVTGITSVDPPLSFWSTQERMIGVVAYLHFWLWCLLVSSTLTQWREWRIFFTFTLCVSAAVNLYGLLYPAGQEKLILSTLANPLFVSVFAMLHFFVALFLLVREKNRAFQVFLVVTMILDSVVILQAGSRGVLLSLVASLGIWLLVAVFTIVRSKKSRLVCACAIMLCVFATGLIFGWLKTEDGSEFGKRYLPPTLARMLYGGRESSEDRFVLWEIGIQGFKERPLVGWGLENYESIYEKYLIPRAYMDVRYDRPHNQLIEVIALTGIIGTGAYLLFWTMLAVTLFRVFRRENHRTRKVAIVALIAFFLSYFIEHLTFFDIPTTLFIFYFTLAFLIFLSKNAPVLETTRKKEKKSMTGLLILLTCCLLFSVIYFVNLVPFFQTKETVRGLAMLQKNPQEAFRLFQKSIQTGLFTNRRALVHISKRADPLLTDRNFLLSHEERLRFVAFLEEKLKEEIGTERQDYGKLHQRLALAFLYLRWYDLDPRPEHIQKARDTLEQARIFSPRRRELVSHLTEVALLQNDAGSAVRYAWQATALASQKDKATSWAHLARAFFFKKDIKNGLKAMRKAEALEYPVYERHNLALPLALAISPHTSADLLFETREYIETIKERTPEDPFLQGAVIIFYERTGKTKEAEPLLKNLEKEHPDIMRQIKKLLTENQ